MLKFIKFIIFFLYLTISAISCGGGHENDGVSNNRSIDELWIKNITPYLREKLWLTEYQYDAGHALMLPLHYAFLKNDVAKISEFASQFNLFNENDVYSLGDVAADKQLARLHYLYLVSEFIRMCNSNKDQCQDNNHEVLRTRVQSEISRFWSDSVFYWYEGMRFPGGIKEHLLYKINMMENIKTGSLDWPSYRYYIGISDFDLFTLAIVANVGSDAEKEASVKFAKIIFDLYGSYSYGNYIFQKGIWYQHPDYRYAGNVSLLPGLTESLIEDLPEDSSHSHRIPLFIRSIISSASDADKLYFKNILEAMSKNFYKNVILKLEIVGENVVALNNYMNGWNGIYRYNYTTVGENLGYGPYQLSGILIEGWWCFLKAASPNDYWSSLERLFPMTNNEVKFYMGPNTTRSRHPLVSWPSFFTNGFGELNSRICSIINE